jgi:hypothetical protein
MYDNFNNTDALIQQEASGVSHVKAKACSCFIAGIAGSNPAEGKGAICAVYVLWK